MKLYLTGIFFSLSTDLLLPDQYLPFPLEHQRESMVQQIFTLVPRLNPSLGFVTEQEIWRTENTNNNNNNNSNINNKNNDNNKTEAEP